MLSKLTKAKWLKGDTAVVGFFGNVARLAKTHQYGLRDRIDRNGPTPQRELLGFTEVDRTRIRDALIEILTSH